jgi:hypothetical protein
MRALNPPTPRGGAHFPGAPRRRLATARRRWEQATYRMPASAQAAAGAAADQVAPYGTPPWYDAAAEAVRP